MTDGNSKDLLWKASYPVLVKKVTLSHATTNGQNIHFELASQKQFLSRETS
jgi:hypothetical protein